MHRILLVGFLIWFLSFNTYGQTDGLNREVSPLHEKDVFILPAMDHQKLIDQYDRNIKSGPVRFAEPRDLYITPQKHGVWESVKSNKLIWRHSIKSVGAHSLNLGFTEFRLPPSASLYIYTPDKSDIIGPFGYSDNDDHLQLWTPVIKGDEVILELQIDASETDYDLVLSRINHDFRDISKSLLSGSCNLDVVCSAMDGWGIVDDYRDIIASVGAISINGIDQCSGVLINNVKNDCRPYFITANHCGISALSAPSVVAYWNYENSVCRQPFSNESGQSGDGSRTQFNSGSILRASYNTTDFALIEFDDPVSPEYDVYFAGWSREMTLADTSICIHHPNVEEKRISFEFNTLDYDPTGSDTTHLLVNDWDIGTTEGGSSGAPLFNTDKQIIGHLNGGLAACGNDEYDSYGWMGRSWHGGGEVTNSLKFWLDPDNEKPMTLDGRSCNYNIILSNNYYEVCGLEQDSIIVVITAGGQFDGDLLYKLIDFPESLIGSLDFTTGPHDQNNRLHISGLSSAAERNLSFLIEISDGQNIAQAEVIIIVENNAPVIPELMFPLPGALNQSLNLDLTVTGIPGSSFRFQVSLDMQFNSIVVDQISSMASLFVKNLEQGRDYYWRVQLINLCGESEWSEASIFSTSFIFCTRIYSLDGPIEISSANPATINSLISIPYGVVVEDINIPNVKGRHEYISDLEIRLNYQGMSSILISDLCNDEDDFNLGFDDQSDLQDIECPPTDQEVYVPLTPLDVFNGSFAGGQWDLSIEDFAFLDGGEFQEWTMELCFTNSSIATLVPEDHRLSICNDEPFSFYCYLDKQGLESYTVKMWDENSEELSIQFTEEEDKYLLIELLDNKQLVNSNTFVRLELIDINQNKVVSNSIINIVKVNTGAPPEVVIPANNTQISPSLFNRIEWTPVETEAVIVQISTDEDFNNNTLTESVDDVNFLELKDDLPEGDYYLRVVKNEQGCLVYSSTINFSIRLGTATQEQELNEQKIYPNPAYDILFVKIQAEEKADISLFNSRGEIIGYEARRHTPEITEIDISLLRQGVYFIRYVSRDISATYSFVKI